MGKSLQERISLRRHDFLKQEEREEEAKKKHREKLLQTNEWQEMKAVSKNPELLELLTILVYLDTNYKPYQQDNNGYAITHREYLEKEDATRDEQTFGSFSEIGFIKIHIIKGNKTASSITTPATIIWKDDRVEIVIWDTVGERNELHILTLDEAINYLIDKIAKYPDPLIMPNVDYWGNADSEFSNLLATK